MEILSQLKQCHFDRMFELEKQFYDEAFITPANEAFHYYKAYPYTTIAIGHEEDIAGFINIFPVKKELFEQIEAGTFNDAELTASDIASLEDPSLYMFLSCIVVNSIYKQQGITKQLLHAAIQFYEPVASRCVAIITDNVTSDGERFSKKFGFQRVCESNHDSVIYKQSYENFVNTVLNK